MSAKNVFSVSDYCYLLSDYASHFNCLDAVLLNLFNPECHFLPSIYYRAPIKVWRKKIKKTHSFLF